MARLVARDAAALCVAGAAQTHIYRRFAWQAWHIVAQTHIYHRFAWQAWHKLTSTIVLRGSCGTDGVGGALGLGLVARDTAALCVAGAAQTHIYRRFPWQAWHKLTSTIVLRDRRGTDGLGGALGLGLVARDAAALCVAGAAQTHIYRRFAWQAWHIVAQTHIYHRFAWQAWRKLTSTIVLRGSRGTDGTGWRAWSWFSRP